MEFAEDCILEGGGHDLEDRDEKEIVRQQSFTSISTALSMQEPQQTPPPPNLPCEHHSCLMSALMGARNGLIYGGKVRFAHSLVMSLLFYSQNKGAKKSLKCLSALRIL